MKKILVGSLVLLAIVVVFGSKKRNSEDHTVKYTICQSSKLNAIYTDGGINAKTVSDADSSCTYRFRTGAASQLVNLSAKDVGGMLLLVKR